MINKLENGWYKLIWDGTTFAHVKQKQDKKKPKDSMLQYFIVFVKEGIVTSKFVKHSDSKHTTKIVDEYAIDSELIFSWGYNFIPITEKEVFVEVI